MTDCDADHFFRVEIVGINEENEELFGGRDEDNIEQLTDYLSFVSPVPYQANFLYRSEIYAYTKKLGIKIGEYNIRINGEQLFKKYKTHLKTGNGRDDVFGVEFHNFAADDGALIGWMWFGKTTFKAAIKEEEIGRGLRLRKENIQIGEDDALREMFTWESSKRGNNYFIGEIFALSPDLIPNSQRSYFNENPTRVDFEHKLKDYFNNTLYYIYYEGSDINSSIKKINSFHEKRVEFEKKVTDGSFLNSEECELEKQALSTRENEAKKALSNLEKKSNGGKSILTAELIARRKNEVSTKQFKDKKTTPLVTKNDLPSNKSKKKFLVDTMFPNHNKSERKLLSETLEKIFAIIRTSSEKKTAEAIIRRIKEDLK